MYEINDIFDGSQVGNFFLRNGTLKFILKRYENSHLIE